MTATSTDRRAVACNGVGWPVVPVNFALTARLGALLVQLHGHRVPPTRPQAEPRAADA